MSLALLQENSDSVASVLSALQLRSSLAYEATPPMLRYSTIGKNVERTMALGKKLRFVLPAFPAKSPNREKTSGSTPDQGEVLGLLNLERLCREIESVYSPGAEVIICSDGRVFNDLVLVSDEEVLAYQDEITSIIIEEGLTHLKTFSLDDCWNLSFQEMRERLVSEFAVEPEVLRERIDNVDSAKQLFNGIHRFITEDRRALFPDRSRNSLSNESKEIAFEVIRRSGAWDRLLETRFSDTLRLSIHPYPLSHHKFGIQLVPGSGRWATPWHNVLVHTSEGPLLMKRSVALSLGAIQKTTEKGHVYFELQTN